MKPEDHLDAAGYAINNQQWDIATAHAATGLLSLSIGLVKALLAQTGAPDRTWD